jgi:hypothetical protein
MRKISSENLSIGDMEEVWQSSGSYVAVFALCCGKFDVGTIRGR